MQYLGIPKYFIFNYSFLLAFKAQIAVFLTIEFRLLDCMLYDSPSWF